MGRTSYSPDGMRRASFCCATSLRHDRATSRPATSSILAIPLLCGGICFPLGVRLFYQETEYGQHGLLAGLYVGDALERESGGNDAVVHTGIRDACASAR